MQTMLTPPLLAIKFLKITAASIRIASGLDSSATSLVSVPRNFFYMPKMSLNNEITGSRSLSLLISASAAFLIVESIQGIDYMGEGIYLLAKCYLEVA